MRVARLLVALATYEVLVLEVVSPVPADGTVREHVDPDAPEVVSVRGSCSGEPRFACARRRPALLEFVPVVPGFAERVANRHRDRQDGADHPDDDQRSGHTVRPALARFARAGAAVEPRRGGTQQRRGDAIASRIALVAVDSASPRSPSGPEASYTSSSGPAIAAVTAATMASTTSMRARPGTIASASNATSGSASSQPRLWPSSASAGEQARRAQEQPAQQRVQLTAPRQDDGGPERREPQRDVRVHVSRRLHQPALGEEVGQRVGAVRTKQRHEPDGRHGQRARAEHHGGCAGAERPQGEQRQHDRIDERTVCAIPGNVLLAGPQRSRDSSMRRTRPEAQRRSRWAATGVASAAPRARGRAVPGGSTRPGTRWSSRSPPDRRRAR